jgi:group I intron endonuclease
MHGIIYLATCLVNEKQYVGQTTRSDPFAYWRRVHLGTARNGAGRYLHRAIRKHGEDNFTFEVIYAAFDQASLDEAEDFFILEFDTLAPNGYNLKRGGANGRLSADSIQKHREGVRAAWQRPGFRERRRKAQEDPRVRQAMSEGARAQWADPDKRAALLEKQNTTKSSASYRERQSRVAKAVWVNMSPEEQRNLTATQRSCYADPEFRERHRAATKAAMDALPPEKRAQMRVAFEQAISDPEFQRDRNEKIRHGIATMSPERRHEAREAQRVAQADGAWRKHQSDAAKAAFAVMSPERREELREQQRASHADPEWRKRHSEKLRAAHAQRRQQEAAD